MSNSFHKVKREILEKRKAALVEEYEAAYEQLGYELDQAKSRRLERKIARLDEDIRGIEEQIDALPESLTDVLQISMSRDGRYPHIDPSGQRWVRLKIRSRKPIRDCHGRIDNIYKLKGADDEQGDPLQTSRASILSWADGKFGPISIAPDDLAKYLDLAWRASDTPHMPADELRVASALNDGHRDVNSPDWGEIQDFITLKPGYYLFIVEIVAEGFDPLERRYRLHWPGPGQEDEIRLFEAS